MLVFRSIISDIKKFIGRGADIRGTQGQYKQVSVSLAGSFLALLLDAAMIPFVFNNYKQVTL